MHSEMRVLKEARTQLHKAQSWISTAFELDDIDEEVAEQYNDAAKAADEALSAAMEARA